MATKYIGFGLATLAAIAATSLTFQGLPEARVQNLSAQAESLIAQNAQSGDRVRSKSNKAILDREFQLKVGQRINVARENLRIKFLRVSEDSRCPADAFCIQQGKAVVVLEAIAKGGTRQEVVITTENPELTVQTSKGNYSIKLIEVQPYPLASSPTKLSEYTIKLIVSKT